MAGTRSMVVITNSEAGSADRAALDAALEQLEGPGCEAEVEVVSTSSPDELDEVVGRLGDREVVVAGGDGSIHAVVQALHTNGALAGRVVGLIPLGTGNDFARTLEIPLDPAEAAAVVAAGHTRPTDLIVDADEQVTVNSVHLGAGAEAGRRGEWWKKRFGRVGYPIGAALTALDPPVLRMLVEVDGELVADIDDPVLMVAMGNGATVGGGTRLTPEADPGDGAIDVMVARPDNLWSRVAYAARLAIGRHPEHPDVTYLCGRTVTVRGSKFWSSNDGEIDGPRWKGNWRLERAAYLMLVPEDGESEGDTASN